MHLGRLPDPATANASGHYYVPLTKLLLSHNQFTGMSCFRQPFSLLCKVVMNRTSSIECRIVHGLHVSHSGDGKITCNAVCLHIDIRLARTAWRSDCVACDCCQYSGVSVRSDPRLIGQCMSWHQYMAIDLVSVSHSSTRHSITLPSLQVST